jgi:hypothetical protein
VQKLKIKEKIMAVNYIPSMENLSFSEVLWGRAYSRGADAGQLVFTMDGISSLQISGAETVTNRTGKKGAITGVVKTAKTATISGTNATFSGGLFAAATGAEVENGAGTIEYGEILKFNAGDTFVTLSKTPAGAVGAEISDLYIKTYGSSIVTFYEQAASATAANFAYDPADKRITLPTGITSGGEVNVTYTANSASLGKITNNSDKFSTPVEAHFLFLATNECDEQFLALLRIPRYVLSGEYTITFSGESTDGYPFSGVALPDSCGGQNQLYEILFTQENNIT